MTKKELRKKARQDAQIPPGWRADVLVYENMEDRQAGSILERPGGDFTEWADAMAGIRDGQLWDVFLYEPFGGGYDREWELSDTRWVKIGVCDGR
tara:strand:- start:1982 stop:2266 length:285 start_codon:yes stop_codon:yes gene_type:complete